MVLTSLTKIKFAFIYVAGHDVLNCLIEDGFSYPSCSIICCGTHPFNTFMALSISKHCAE